eukprot:3134997-Rhodomonas_salina.2
MLDPVKPALHVQSASSMLAGSEKAFSSPHVTHLPRPVSFLYVPPAQATHNPPPSSSYPFAHVQLLYATLPSPDVIDPSLAHSVQLDKPSLSA